MTVYYYFSQERTNSLQIFSYIGYRVISCVNLSKITFGAQQKLAVHEEKCIHLSPSMFYMILIKSILHMSPNTNKIYNVSYVWKHILIQAQTLYWVIREFLISDKTEFCNNSKRLLKNSRFKIFAWVLATILHHIAWAKKRIKKL